MHYYFSVAAIFAVINIGVLTKLSARQLIVAPTTTTYTRGGSDDEAIPPKSSSNKCLNLGSEESMDDLISNHRHVIITFPAKAAGTSMKDFTARCNGKIYIDNFLNYPEYSKTVLNDALHLPPIISSHILTDQPLIDLAQHSSRKTLIIYIHREETDRLKSAIRYVLNSRVCGYATPFMDEQNTNKMFNLVKNDTHCILDETIVLRLIESKGIEIRMGSTMTLTCDAYEAIEQNAPDMVFMHYKQVDKLQRLLTKHHCPKLLNEAPARHNYKGERKMNVYLRLKNKGKDGEKVIVNVDDWLEEKIYMMEWALKMKKNITCQAKTRHMEEELFGCPGEALKTVSAGIKQW